jgi:hypothetical protein
VEAEYEVAKGSKYRKDGRKVRFERQEYDDITVLIPLDRPTGEDGSVDIADHRAFEIYEIKPRKSEGIGRAEMIWYLAHLPGYRMGSRQYPEGTRVIGDWPAPFNRDWDIVAWID